MAKTKEWYQQLSIELVRAVRGNRSRAELSRRLGYQSNVVRRWEGGHSFPTAARFLEAHRRLHHRQPSCFEQYFQRRPVWQSERIDATTVAAFLTDIKGKTPTMQLARLGGFNRYSVGRWLSGRAEPRLPEFLALVDVATRRLIDWLATLTDPAALPSVTHSWHQQQLAREAAYAEPWSHAVLRALELDTLPKKASLQLPWLAERLSVAPDQVRSALHTLEQTGQAERWRGRYRVVERQAVDTGLDPVRARRVKAALARAAVDRLDAGSPGNFGYSVFAISKADLVKLRDLHLHYVRAMQELIARSKPNECVGLYCSQLLDLARDHNALGPR